VQYILVLQWPADLEADYDALIAMEDALEGALPAAHGFVDGHDFGAGEMNIFVHTDEPLEAFGDALSSLGSHPRWEEVRAAYRPTEGDHYILVWPEMLKDFSVS